MAEERENSPRDGDEPQGAKSDDGDNPPGGDATSTPPSEPQGGPFARQREFFEQRHARLTPKSAGGGPQVAGLGDGATPPPVQFEPPPPAPTTGPAVAGAPQPPAPSGADATDSPSARRNAALQEGRAREAVQRKARRAPAPPPGEDEDAPPGPSVAAAPQPAPANNWVPLGPSVLRKGQAATQPGTSGRTPGIAVSPDGLRVYAGAANGGVWRSNDAGVTWRSTMDAFDLDPLAVGSDSLACGAVAIDLADPDRVYVGSGEGAGGDYFGVGPVVSSDGGATWGTEPVSPTSATLVGSAFFSLAVDPNDRERVVGATRSGIYRREPDGSGGFHWDSKNVADARTNWFTSVVVAREGNTTTFYAACWGGPIYSSADGDTWAPVGTTFSSSQIGRITLAVQPESPTVVYALVSRWVKGDSDGSFRGVWRLDIPEDQWREVQDIPPGLFGTPRYFQGHYDQALAVDPDDADIIYLGGSTTLAGNAYSGAIYRAAISSQGTGPTRTYRAASTYIGASTHADIHTLVFTPGDASQLWVGCDGGVFFTDRPRNNGNDVFVSRNTGLATLSMNHLAQHPTEDAVLFCGTQDNGGARFTGEAAWLHSVWGDSGFFVINWHNPYEVLSTYVGASINRTINGGGRYDYASVDVPLLKADSALFYAPLVGTPPSGTASQARRVAFGSSRPWVSDDFGDHWRSIPADSTTDILGGTGEFRIKSMIFANHAKLYVGLLNGRVYRFDETNAGWTRTRLDTLGGNDVLQLGGVVTDITVDPADATQNSIYVVFGGSGDFRHVWHFDGTAWTSRSGPQAAVSDRLLDVNHNALVADPDNPAHLYAGADIGVWRSTDGGATWCPFSEGLPDAAVLDLKVHAGRRLLRVSTYGRGVFERTMDTDEAAGIELYVRDTQLDQGRSATIEGLPDPTDATRVVTHGMGPDIKADTPDPQGDYQYAAGESIDFFQFTDALEDDALQVATHATDTLTTRVYVQVHNRGLVPANGVRITALVGPANGGLPPLPASYAGAVRAGQPIADPTGAWKDLGSVTVDDLRVGFPKITMIELPSDQLPAPADLPSQEDQCMLLLVHQADDSFTNTEVQVEALCRSERKAAHKLLRVVEFLGAVPVPMSGPIS